jgi:hypothetical protein
MKRRETYIAPAWSEKRKDRLAVTLVVTLLVVLILVA